jgi:hypothetical protein
MDMRMNFECLLFRTSAETLLEVARDPRHLGAETGFFSVLHTWFQGIRLRCGNLSTWIETKPDGEATLLFLRDGLWRAGRVENRCNAKVEGSTGER